jgi:hypothetical protein
VDDLDIAIDERGFKKNSINYVNDKSVLHMLNCEKGKTKNERK